MKCDTCANYRFMSASSNPDVGMPWAEAWCAAGEWGGVPDPNEPEAETDPWINCEKYKDNGKSDTDTRQDIRPNS